MKNLEKLNRNEIIELIKQGLDLMITGFSKIGFRRKTNERLDALEKQVALLSKKAVTE